MGWLSRHSEASRELYRYFHLMDQFLTTLFYQSSERFRLNSPVVKDAVVETKLAFLEEDITTPEKALLFIPILLKHFEPLKNITKRIAMHRTCLVVPFKKPLKRSLRRFKVDKAA